MASLFRHAPEHETPAAPVAPAGCCCCCCCLHTLGGLGGAIAGCVIAIEPKPKDMPKGADFPFRRDEFEDDEILPVRGLYWVLAAFSLVIGTMLFQLDSILTGAMTPEQAIYTTIGGFICCFPIAQLFASGLTALIVAFFATYKEAALWRVWKITWCSFLGTILGFGVMLVLGIGLMAIAR